MRLDIRAARSLTAALGLTVALALPAGAQAAGGTSTTSTATMNMSDTTRTEHQDRGFPWGLLGLLGLAGLLKRPQRETVVQREPTYRDPNAGGTGGAGRI